MHTSWNEPFERFTDIFARAKQAQASDPNQMWLATVDERGRPQVRVVLLKEFDSRGFVFYTNSRSAKGRALAAHPFAALDFYWQALGEQVRVEGAVEPVSGEEADAYFATRPLDSKLGAWASEQSQPLASREALEARVAELRKQYGEVVPRPPHWGGYRVKPDRIELWRAHPHRLHWREAYVKQGDGWDKSLLYP